MSGRGGLENINPQVYGRAGSRPEGPNDWNDDVSDPFDAREIFDLIRHIRDPEHPLTLEELNVVSSVLIRWWEFVYCNQYPDPYRTFHLWKCNESWGTIVVFFKYSITCCLHQVEENACKVEEMGDGGQGRVVVHFTPTIPHCSMASLIGLSIRLKLLQTLPSRWV